MIEETPTIRIWNNSS